MSCYAPKLGLWIELLTQIQGLVCCTYIGHKNKNDAYLLAGVGGEDVEVKICVPQMYHHNS